MPSVSEPFGISPLEGLQCGLPQSFRNRVVAERFLTNCIKVDCWDINALADAIYSICHNEVSSITCRMKANAVDQITWEKVGGIKNLYERVIAHEL